MKGILSYNNISCGQLWSAGFFLRCRSLVIPLKKAKLKLWGNGPCDVRNNALPFILHDLTNIPRIGTISYCELYGNSYITITISNPYMGVDMTDMGAVGNLDSFRLTFDPTASTEVTNRVNGTLLMAASPPLADKTNESILTWKPCHIPAFGILEDLPCSNESNTINALAANDLLHPGGSRCRVASNKIHDFIVTGDFVGCSSECPMGDTYKGQANTSVQLGGKISTCG